MLKPLNDAVFGVPVYRDDYSDLASEVGMLTREFDNAYATQGSRALVASLAAEPVPFLIQVEAAGPECREITPGDLAILPKGGGTMVTITENNTPRRVYMISEAYILAIWRD